VSAIKSISVVIPVTERGDQLLNVFDGYYENIKTLGIDYEFLIILIPEFGLLAGPLKEKYKSENVKVIFLNRNYGEAVLLHRFHLQF